MASEFKDISDLIKQGMQVEAIEKLLDLRTMMADIRDENLALKETVKKLEASLEEKTKLVYEAPFYWMIEDGNKDGPFCQQCSDSSKITIRLQLEGNDYWTCRTCKQAYNGPDYQIPRLF
jgi:hypothetical protein